MSDLNPAGRELPPPLLALPLLAYKWLVVIPILLVSTAIIGGVIITPLSILGFPDFSSRVFATFWAKLNAFFTLMTVTVDGRENIRAGQSYVVVANHQSLLDIYALYGFSGLEIKWVMKKELRNVPVLGYACEVMGHIIIDRSNSEAAIASINQARTRISDGMCVVFFPEGTRSRDGSLKDFKKGAFKLAIELGVPVLPISIKDTNKILPSDTLDWHPGHARMTIHRPISTHELSENDVASLATAAREQIQSGLD